MFLYFNFCLDIEENGYYSFPNLIRPVPFPIHSLNKLRCIMIDSLLQSNNSICTYFNTLSIIQ